jgi:hypothetical protein
MNGTFNLDGPLNINGITTLNNSLITPSLKVNNNNIKIIIILFWIVAL